ncbi:TPA: hypothetical protein IAA87_09135 [Candidatus Avigastranaerophilus faecigallinarum]|nr:hypothetical protein [Candidatus Avigastranaerophilus faecigallinarum]
MSYQQSNKDFFSYQGTINRKDYTINMLIVIALSIGISLVRFDNFVPYIKPEFLYKILMFMVNLFQFVMLMSAISLIYRRIADFSILRSPKYIDYMKKTFFILFVFPILYLFCFRFFIDIVPFLQNIMDIFVIFFLAPLGVITAFLIAFIKGS